MSAIDEVFTSCREQKRAAFIPFIMAGDPDIETTPRLLEAAAVRRRRAQGGLRPAAARDWESIYDALVHDYRSIAAGHEAAAAACLQVAGSRREI